MMNRLTGAAIDRVQRFALAIHGAGSVEMLRRLIPEQASSLIPSDRANFNEIDLSVGESLILPWPVPAYWQRLSPVLLAHMHEHVLGDAKRPLPCHRGFTFSDRRNDPAWSRSTLYHEYYLPAGARHQLFVHLFQRDAVRRSLAYNRERRDFTSSERSILELASPHVACAWANAERLDRLRRSPTSQDVTLGTHHLIAHRETHKIISVSSDTIRLLRRYTVGSAFEPDYLPDTIVRWLKSHYNSVAQRGTIPSAPIPLRCPGAGGALTLRVVQLTEYYAVVWMVEEAHGSRMISSSEGKLTAREHEILRWVSEGKRNVEIAIICGLSDRTVGKHLENIFRKLGVETRTAAARAATAVLGHA